MTSKLISVAPGLCFLTTGGSLAEITLGTSAATPDPASSYSATTGLFSDGANAVATTIGGNEMMRVNATGVGIGTSNPGALFTVGSNAFEVNSSGTVLAGTWNGNTVTVPYGGTGATSLAVHGVVVGEGTSTVNVVPVGTSGYVLTSNGVSADPTFTQLNLGSGGFAGVLPVTSGGTGTATQFTQGSIVFAGASGVYTQDNSQFFWNDTTHSLGIGTANPMSQLQINGGEVQIGSSGASCTTSNAGAVRYSGVTLYFCNGTAWTPSSAGGASGTVNIGSQYQMAYYAADGTVVSGDTSITTDSSNDLIIGLGKLGIGTTSPVVSLDLRAETDAIALPVGTTGQEPASPVNGMIRYNSSVGVQDLEAYVNGAWTTLTTGSNVGTASIYLGSSASTPDPARNGEPTTGLFTAGSGLVDVSSLGTQVAEFSSTGLNLGTSTATIESVKLGGLNGISYPTSDTTIGASIAIGPSALAHLPASAAYGDIAFGYQTLSSASMTTAAVGNTAVGYRALKAITSGNNNVAIGSQALTAGTSANQNIAMGNQALLTDTSAVTTVAIGQQALMDTQGSQYNVAIGYGAMLCPFGPCTPTYDVAVGQTALFQNTGQHNAALGGSAGYSVVSGSQNTILGDSVASNTLNSGNYNILIGTNNSVDTPTAATSNFLNIGNTIFATNTMTGTLAAPAGSVGIGTANPMSALHIYNAEVQIGSSGASCTANNAGAVRYSGGTLYFCNGSTWTGSSAGGGSGTVNIGSQYQMAYYAANGTVVSGDTSITTDSSNDLIVGSGKLGIGTTSPVVSLDLRAETDAIAFAGRRDRTGTGFARQRYDPVQ